MIRGGTWRTRSAHSCSPFWCCSPRGRSSGTSPTFSWSACPGPWTLRQSRTTWKRCGGCSWQARSRLCILCSFAPAHLVSLSRGFVASAATSNLYQLFRYGLGEGSCCTALLPKQRHKCCSCPSLDAVDCSPCAAFTHASGRVHLHIFT